MPAASYPNFAGKHAEDAMFTAAFVISDSLADLVWTPWFKDPRVESGLIELYQAGRNALMA